MTKYLGSAHELVEELANRDKEGVYNWVEKYLFHGYTAPLIGVSSIQSKSSFLTQLAEQSGDNTPLRKNLEKAVANCYNKFFDDKKLSHKEKVEIATDLFVIIGRVEINDLFKRLKEDALNEKYKGINVRFGTHVDLHTFLLKSLFGLERNKEKYSLTQIIDRDIHNLKYSLDCFNAFYSSVGEKISGIRYMPILVNQIDGANRDVVGELKDYVEILEKADFSCFHELPTKRLTNKEIKTFSYMLNILNKNIGGYNLQINKDNLTIHNTKNQKTRIISMNNKLTEEIRSSLKYIPPN